MKSTHWGGNPAPEKSSQELESHDIAVRNLSWKTHTHTQMYICIRVWVCVSPPGRCCLSPAPAPRNKSPAWKMSSQCLKGLDDFNFIQQSTMIGRHFWAKVDGNMPPPVSTLAPAYVWPEKLSEKMKPVRKNQLGTPISCDWTCTALRQESLSLNWLTQMSCRSIIFSFKMRGVIFSILPKGCDYMPFLLWVPNRAKTTCASFFLLRGILSMSGGHENGPHWWRD